MVWAVNWASNWWNHTFAKVIQKGGSLIETEDMAAGEFAAA